MQTIDLVRSIIQILAPIFSALFVALILWWLKIPGSLKDNAVAVKSLADAVNNLEESLEDMVEKINRHDRQHQVTQKIFSDMIGESIDLQKIADDFSEYPPNVMGKVKSNCDAH